MIEERAYEYFINQGKNCAESVILAANDEYGLKLDETAIKAIGAFGGGIKCGSLCGALAGGAGAIGAKFIETDAHHCPALDEKLPAFIAACTEKFGSQRCDEIKPKFFKEDVRCLDVVQSACKILEDYMK